MVVHSTGIDDLPSELIIQILNPFSTPSLLRLAPLSHRYHSIIHRIFRARLQSAASLISHKLILESFHPSEKLSTPSLTCDYLGTDSFNTRDIKPSPSSNIEVGSLSHLANLYSHFRPLWPESEARYRRPPSFRPQSLSSSDTDTATKKKGEFDIPSTTITLESWESFYQLCTITNLVKLGPKPGLFMSCVTIGDSVLRVWRQWLASHAVSSIDSDVDVGDCMLWLDDAKNVGLRLRVIERPDLVGHGPILRARDEEPTVVYTVQYEELVIKAKELLVKTEEALVQEGGHEGKAVVIGTW